MSVFCQISYLMQNRDVKQNLKTENKIKKIIEKVCLLLQILIVAYICSASAIVYITKVTPHVLRCKLTAEFNSLFEINLILVDKVNNK